MGWSRYRLERNNSLARCLRTVRKRGTDVVGLELRIDFQQFSLRRAFRQVFQNQRYPDACPTDAGLTETDIRVRRNSRQKGVLIHNLYNSCPYPVCLSGRELVF
jgi:hypothetical protein